LITATVEEPSLIAGLVRMSTASMLEGALWDGLAAHQWAEPELRKIDADLATLDWLKDYLFAMGSERASFNATADMLIKDRRVANEFLGMSSGIGRPSPTARSMVYLLYPAGWLYQSKVRAGHFFDELLGRVEPAQRRWFGERPVPSSPANIPSPMAALPLLLFRITAPAYEAIEAKYLRTAAVTDEARLACALERFYLARGNYPEEIKELVPDFLPVLPVEIVNGQPYHYHRTEDGRFVLYSVGTDLRDDGGVFDPKLSASKQADWVWSYPAK
jgi:hypothetical protein